MPDLFNGVRVEAIPGAPLPYGLQSAATILDPEDPHELNGVEWLPMSCAQASTTDWCTEDVLADKTFAGPSAVRAEPVAVYFGYECSPIGQTYDEASTYAKAGLAIGEPRAIESWFMSEVLSPAAVDLTPGIAASGVVEALSILEGALAIEYGGVGVIHAPASAGSYLGHDGNLVKDGARYRTWVGNLVAIGAGYELANTGPGGAAGAGEAWLYATGPVVARREPVALLPSDEGQSVNIVTNDRILLAERVWVMSYECAAYAVLVDLGSTVIDGGPP